MGSAINIALPAIEQEYRLNAILLGWVATSYLLAAAVFLLPFGKLSDIIGRKRIYLVGIIIYTISSALCALVPGVTFLILFRVAQGIGSAMIFGTGVAILTSVFPPHERGKALGTSVAFTYAGLSLGPVVGGVLTQQLGWRSVFWANVPFGIVAAVLVLWKLKGEWAEAKGERLDTLGGVIAAVGLGLLIYGLSLLPSAAGAACIVLGAAGMLAFFYWETRVPYPLLDMNLLSTNRVFAMSNLAALINYSATFAVTFFLSLYLQYNKALDAQSSGLVLLAQPIVMAVVSPIAGRLSDRVQSRVLASIGMGTMAVMLAALSFLTSSTPIWYIVVCLMFLGLGYGLFSSPNANAIMGSVDRRVYGVASATMGTMRLVGQMLSMGVALLIVSIRVGGGAITPSKYPQVRTSLSTAFVIFALLCVVGIFTSLARGRLPHPGEAPGQE